MKIHLRYREGEEIEYDKTYSISSQKEWKELIYDPRLISSILWPDKDLFEIKSKYVTRKHCNEIDYQNDLNRNLSYLNGCREIAKELERKLAGANCLIYAPMRGALPIWRGISQFIENIKCTVYYPVTSSFISFPNEFGILGRRGKTASGRFNNRFELERIQPFLINYDYFIYVDEIVSGGMMRGHLKDFFRINLNEQIPIIAVGLADAFGRRSESNRSAFEEMSRSGKINAFIWSGCESLITEDQKFLLGAHFVDYDLGPHIVPLLNTDLRFYSEKEEFDNFVYRNLAERNVSLDPFLSGFPGHRKA